jgi:C4-type Zn-finger protein
MAKKQTFMDKMKKAKLTGPSCPVCGEQISMVRVIDSIATEGAPVKFRRHMVKMCKCNQKEVMGA